jgi:hypothetical protein
MKRRDFIIGGGTVFTAGMLTYAATSSMAEDTGDSRPRRPDPAEYDTPSLKALAFGMSAPNPHNTQAWKFKLLSDLEFLLYVDAGRLLRATDPPGRQVHIGCGCFLGVMAAGVSSLGYHARIGILPEGGYGVDEAGRKPVASVRLERMSDVPVDPLSAHISKRRTNRSGYEDAGVSAEVFRGMVSAVAPRGCSILKVDEPAVLAEHLGIHHQAMAVESRTYKAYDESRIWFRENDVAIASKRDGINLPAGGTTGLTRFVAERMLKGLDPKDWHKPSTIDQHLSGYRRKIMETRTLVQFVTSANTQRDWVAAGMDYARFQLAATGAGYFLHPMSQVLQEFPEMDALRTRYEALCGVSSPGKIQMVVRMGRAKEPFESYRRDVRDLLMA